MIGVEKHDLFKNLEGAEVSAGVLSCSPCRGFQVFLGLPGYSQGQAAPGSSLASCHLFRPRCVRPLSGFPEACCGSPGQIPTWKGLHGSGVYAKLLGTLSSSPKALSFQWEAARVPHSKWVLSLRDCSSNYLQRALLEWTV